MSRKQLLIVCVLGLITSLPAVAREPVPIINHEKIEIITGTGNPPTTSQVAQAIKTAAAYDPNRWEISDSGDGKLEARTLVRNKHTVIVEIPYTTTSYGVLYKDSSNMKYDVRDGTPVIHPFYNRWVDSLIGNIRRELLQL